MKNYTLDPIDEERTVWIEKYTNFSEFDDHRVTVLGRRHEIQGVCVVCHLELFISVKARVNVFSFSFK